MMQKCLVTGASGFIGKVLCRALKNQNLFVRALFRKTVSGPWDEVIEYDFEHLKTQSLPNDLMQGIDTVFHLAGIAHSFASSEKYNLVNIEATRALLSLGAKSNIKKFIFFSSTKAIHPEDDYGRSKNTAELLILDFGRKYNIHVTILRPSLVYGPGVKGNLAALIKAIKKGILPPLPENKNQRSMVSVDDLVSAALLVAEKAETNGKIYTVTDGIPYSTRELIDGIRKALHFPPIKRALPIWFIRFVLCSILHKKALYEKLMGSFYFSNEFICNELKWMPKQTFFTVLPTLLNDKDNLS